MKEHVNFYENLAEAQMRLTGTVVMYDGQPGQISHITDHKKDGIFRAYFIPIGLTPEQQLKWPNPPYPNGSNNCGPFLDKWMEENPDFPMLRKHLSSPLFNKFRPFPLGMMNVAPNVYYVERVPNRKVEQGLTRSMLSVIRVTAGTDKSAIQPDVHSEAFKSCVLGTHPPAKLVLENLISGNFANDGAAFHREFALVRGGMGAIYLAYRADIIGVLPDNDFSSVRLGNYFKHTREVVEELKLFEKVV